MLNVSFGKKNYVNFKNLGNSGKNDSHLSANLLKDDPDKIHLSFKKKLYTSLGNDNKFGKLINWNVCADPD